MNSISRKLLWTCAGFLLGGGVLACSNIWGFETLTGSEADAASDDSSADGSSTDTGSPDAGLDTGSPDAGHDAGLDARSPDAGLDAGFDAGLDAGSPDAGSSKPPQGSCSQSLCTASVNPETPGCDPNGCVTKVCNQDYFCCATAWDTGCVQDVAQFCSPYTCN